MTNVVDTTPALIARYQEMVLNLQELLRDSIQQNKDRDILLQQKEEQIQTLIIIVGDLRDMVERLLGRSIIQ